MTGMLKGVRIGRDVDVGLEHVCTCEQGCWCPAIRGWNHSKFDGDSG